MAGDSQDLWDLVKPEGGGTATADLWDLVKPQRKATIPRHIDEQGFSPEALNSAMAAEPTSEEAAAGVARLQAGAATPGQVAGRAGKVALGMATDLGGSAVNAVKDIGFIPDELAGAGGAFLGRVTGSKYIEQGSKDFLRTTAGAKAATDIPTDPEDPASQLGGALGLMGAAAASGGVAPAAVLFGASNGVALHQKVLEETGDPVKAMAGLIGGGAAGAGLSVLPAARILARINGQSGGVLVRAIGDVGADTGSGFLYGAGQSAINDTIEKYATGKDIPILQNALEQGALGSVATLIGSGLGAAVAKTEKPVTDKAAPLPEPTKIEPSGNPGELPPPVDATPPVEQPPPAAVEQHGKAAFSPESSGVEGAASADETGAAPVTKLPLRAVEPKSESAPEKLPVREAQPEAKQALPVKPSAESLGMQFGGVTHQLSELLGLKQRPPVGGKNVETLPSAEDGFYPSAETKAQAVQRKIADRFVKLRATEQEAPGKGSDFSGSEVRMHGRAAHAQDMLDRAQDRAVRLLKNAGLSAEDIGQRATARHAETRNAIIAERTKGENLEGSGMSDAQAREILATPNPAADQALKIHDEVRDKALDFAVESGLVSPAEAKAWRDKFGDTFTSLKTIGDEEGRAMPGVGKSLQVRGKESKRAEGRTTEATNPFVSTFQNAQDIILRGEKNLVAQEFGKLVKNNPGPWAEVVEPKVHENKNGEKVFEAPSGEDIFTYKVHGIPEYIRVHDKATLKALKNLDPVAAGTFLRLAAKGGRLMSGLATSRNPDFVARNLARDLQTAVGNVSAEESVKTAAKIVKDVGPSMKEMFRAAREPEKATGYAKEYQEHGGLTDWIEPTTPQERLASMEKRLAETPVREKLRALADAVSDISGSVENGTRFAYFKALRRAGVSADEAAVKAKELTVNWSKKGEWSATMNALYLFSSANANGTVRLATAMARKPQRAAAVAGSLTAAGFFMAMLNDKAGGTDEKDGRQWWDKQNEANKRRYAMIQHSDGTTTRLPLAPGWGFFWYLGGKLYDAQKTGDFDTGNVVRAAVDQVSPVGGGSLGQIVTPWFLDPFVSASENKDYAGRNVYTDRDEHDKRPYASLPGEQRASDTSKAISRLANDLTGGDESRQGIMDIPPRSLDYVAAESGSGLGRFMQRVGKTATDIMHGEMPLWRDMPIINGFKGDTPNTYGRDFYSIVDKIETEQTAMKGGKPFDASVLAFKAAASSTQSNIAKLRSAGQDAAADKLAADFIKAFDARKKR